HHVAWADVAVQVFLLMHIIQSVGNLGQYVDALAMKILALGFDQEIEAHPLDQFHDQVLFTLPGKPILEGLDDILVAQGRGDEASQGPVHSREARFESGGFFLVENLETDRSAQVSVASPENLRHTPLPRSAHDLETLVDVDDREVGFGARSEQFSQV